MRQHVPEQAAQLRRAFTHLVQCYPFRDCNAMCCYGIAVAQCHVLDVLGEGGTLTMQAVAQHLQLAVRTVTCVVDPLVDKGLLARHTGAIDWWVCEVVLMPRSTALLRTLQGERIAREQAVLARRPAAAPAHVIWAIEALSRTVDTWHTTVPQDSAGGEQ